MEKKLDGNNTRMLRAIRNKSWRQHSTKQQLYGHLPPITKTIQVRRTRHAGHCRRSRDELINDVLQWTLAHARAKAGWLARTYIQQLCEDTGCSPEDLPEAMNDRKEWHDKMMMMMMMISLMMVVCKTSWNLRSMINFHGIKYINLIYIYIYIYMGKSEIVHKPKHWQRIKKWYFVFISKILHQKLIFPPKAQHRRK